MNENAARTINVAPVRKSITVQTSPDRAFEVFTRGMSRWWLKHYSINRGSPIKDVVIEPRVDGRWYEIGEDGSSCDWGKVLVWDPPARLVLTWQITPEFCFDPDLVTELEVRFTPEGDGTQVSLEHRLDGYGPAASDMFKLFDGPEAWAGILESFARAAA
jgi:uncharacterized protein YndB with AHSA1/START domain